MTLFHDPLPRLLLQLALVVLLSRLLGAVARRFGQPQVVGEIAAGIALGPSLFGALAPQLQQQVFAPESLSVLGVVSQLGLVCFMFLLGLELDPALLRGRAQSSIMISHASIAVPFGLGALLALYFHPLLAPPGVPLLPFVLFIGAALSITAFPVLARILAEQGLLRTKLGALTIACAAIDDVTAWCILAVVVAVTRSTGTGTAVVTVLLALAYIALMLLVVRPLLARLAERARGRVSPASRTAVIVVLLLASSLVTELLGIHALFGAFLFGATLPKPEELGHEFRDRLEELVLVALLPLFFAYSGIRTQLGLLNSVEAWGQCLLVIVVACSGKFLASAGAARMSGLNLREASLLGVLMNTRGMVELIVLNVGLDLGVISPRLFTMMVIMALVTTLMTTPLVRRLRGATSELAESKASSR